MSEWTHSLDAETTQVAHSYPVTKNKIGTISDELKTWKTNITVVRPWILVSDEERSLSKKEADAQLLQPEDGKSRVHDQCGTLRCGGEYPPDVRGDDDGQPQQHGGGTDGQDGAPTTLLLLR